MATLHLLIKGKVQGVFYRATARQVANELGITGWVKNTDEGNVEAVVTGDEKQLQAFVTWCKQGPSRANVTEVLHTDHKETMFEEFTVLR